MAELPRGILGGFSGLVGTVVGSTYRELDVMKAKPRKSGKAGVQSQIDQRNMFGTMTKFLSKMRDTIEFAFKPFKKLHSPMNSAVSYNVVNAFSGDSPDFKIDFSKLEISNGILLGVMDLKITPTAGKLLKIDWTEVDAKHPKKKLLDLDQVMLLFYHPESGWNMPLYNVGLRGDTTVTAELPRSWVGSEVYGWIFFMTPDHKVSSRSQYLGEFELIA